MAVGLQLEGTSTPLGEHSFDLSQQDGTGASNAWQPINCTLTQDGPAGMFGETSWRLQNTTAGWSGIGHPIQLTASTRYQYQYFLRPGNHSWMQIGGVGSAGNGSSYINFNLTTLEIGNATVEFDPEDMQLTQLANGWVQVIFTWISGGSSTGISGPHLAFAADGTTDRFTNIGDGSEYIHVSGMDQKAEAFPTSALKTDGTLTARNATSFHIPFTAMPLIPDTGFTNDFCGQVVLAPNFNNGETATNPRFMVIGTGSNRMELVSNGTDVGGAVIASGTPLNGYLYAGVTFGKGDTLDIRFKVSSTEGFTIWVNGTRVNDATQTAGIDVAATVAWVGSQYGASDHGDGVYQSMRIYGEALTDEEIEAWLPEPPEFVWDFTTGTLPPGSTFTR